MQAVIGKNRGGRPKRKLSPGERVPLGLRVQPEIKNELDSAAVKSGRSQSQEAEFRLEQSFRTQSILNEALALRYGPELAGILRLVGDAIAEAGPDRGYAVTQTLEG